MTILNNKELSMLDSTVEFLKKDILKNLYLSGTTQHVEVIGGYVILLLNSYVYMAISAQICEHLSIAKRNLLAKILHNHITTEKYSPNCDFKYLEDFIFDLLGIELKSLIATDFVMHWQIYLKDVEDDFIENSNPQATSSFFTEKGKIERTFKKDPFGKFRNAFSQFKLTRAEVAHPHLQYGDDSQQRNYMVEAMKFYIFAELLLLLIEKALKTYKINVTS